MKKPSIINLILPIFGASAMTVGAIVPPVVEHFFPSVYEQIYNCAVDEFLGICNVPHIANDCSAEDWNPDHDTLKEMRDYLTNVVESYLGSGTVGTDYNGNIWWDIPASKGSENLSPIALQGHMDMVWDAQGEAEDWDPLNHPVATPVFDVVDGKKVIHTKNWLTSLGSDDGQGIGLLLALTKKRDIYKHPMIRCVLTVDEETSGRGADLLGCDEYGRLQYPVLADIPYLINIDGGPIGQINISSGASRGYRFSMIAFSDTTPSLNNHVYKIKVTGGKGGHSGVDIDKNPCNAVGVACVAAEQLFYNHIRDAQLIAFDSGEDSSRTKIPSDSSIKFITSYGPDYVSEKFKIIERWFDNFMTNYDEPNMRISIEEEEAEEEQLWSCLSHKKTIDVLGALVSLPFGVYAKAEDGSVSVSSNISPIWFVAGDPLGFVFETLTRFNVSELGRRCVGNVLRAFGMLVDRIQSWDDDNSFAIELVDDFPEWEESKDLSFANKVKDEFSKSGIRNPYLFRCHPGLECGFFYKDWPSLNQVSIGANVLNEHNIKEMLELDSYYQLTRSLINLFADFNETPKAQTDVTKK